MLEREPHIENSRDTVLELARRNAAPYISGTSVTDIYYICRKSGLEKAVILEYLQKLMDIFDVLIIDKESINEAIASGIKDFEDAVQITACKKENIDLIITRNKKDFANNWIDVQSPSEYLQNTN